MKKIIFATISILIIAIGVGGYLLTNQNQKINNNSAKKINVVSSFSIINSIVEEIGGKYVNANTITAIGADQHEYQPTPTDMSRVQNASIVFSNGLNLEKGGSGWFEKMLKTTNKKSTDVTDDVEIIKLTTKGVLGSDNPHAWNGILEGKIYAANIEKKLAKVDPKHASYYQDRSKRYQEKLQELFDKWSQKFSALPDGKKVLITQEAAMTYFARDFNLKTYFIWEIDTESNGTPLQIKTLVDQLKTVNQKALFVEQGESTKPMKTVANEINGKIAGTLWTDSISKKNGVVPTYYDLLNHNAEVIYDGISSN